MKKFVSLILTVCFIFLAANVIWPANILTEEKSDTLSLCSVSEFKSKLESENVDVNDEDAYEICVLLELDDATVSDASYFDAKSINVDGDDVDTALKEHRNKVKEYYLAYNENIASSLNLDEYEYYVSYYSPYIEILFDDLAEYERCEYELINSVIDPEIIVSVCNYALIDATNYEATVDPSGYSTNYPLSTAFDDIGVSSSPFTGNGVNVGIIDGNVPFTDNLKPGKYELITSYQDTHSTVIASIIGGTSGIAEDVYFYCMQSTGSLVSDCNLMINTYGVNIINMSLGFATEGRYTNFDACIDTIISNTGCTFVKSAGNKGLTNAYVTAPGCAMNAITVGSMNYSHNVRANSSWNVTDAFLLKPDVVAPGGRLWDIPNLSNGSDGHSGTSYAAPMVVGTIALLMEEFPVLKTNPALVKSVLHLGAEYLSSQTSYFDQQAGFGILNYQNMRLCLQNANYVNFNIPTTADVGSIVVSKYVTIPYLHGIAVNANTIVNSSMTTSSSVTATPTYTDYSIKMYDISLSKYVASSSINSSVDYLMFTNTNQNNSSFRIDIVLDEDSASTESEAGAIAYTIDDHSFNLYLYNDNKSHIKRCSCGAYLTEGHYIRQADIVNNRYVRCLGCRALLDLFEGYANSIMSTITQVSINGSYVLHSGIVVLVDEDIQAYLDGTLVFYHPDNIPTTQ